MPLINAILSWLMKNRYHQIELFMKYPLEVQEEWFRKLIAAGQQTEFGREYGFDSISRPEEYASRVPIHEYEDIQPYINRVMKGEQMVLWPSEIKWFAKSSGTTGNRSKYIPVSQESLEECHFKGGKDMLSMYVVKHEDSTLFDGRSLGLGGTHQVSENNSEAYYGDLSAIIIQNLPFWAEFIRTPDLSIALMADWESKLDLMAKATQGHNVTSIAGVPSWTLLLMQKVLEISGAERIDQVWPNLEVFFHGGVSFEPYRAQFRAIMPPDINYIETYNASEGFFGIQDRPGHNDMLLMLDYGIYYEFEVLSGHSPGSGKVIPLSEVETGVNYAIIISTNAGLWRYRIGDTVEFSTLSPYRIRITGRTRSFINIVGEELIVDNAEKALLNACNACSCSVAEFSVGPASREDGRIRRHQWLVEFREPPLQLDHFRQELDAALRKYNSDYDAKRHGDLLLSLPQVEVLAPGTFYRWLKMKNKLGGQHKVPRLSNSREIIDEILAMPPLK
jgi:hypothetical protein